MNLPTIIKETRTETREAYNPEEGVVWKFHEGVDEDGCYWTWWTKHVEGKEEGDRRAYSLGKMYSCGMGA